MKQFVRLFSLTAAAATLSCAKPSEESSAECEGANCDGFDIDEDMVVAAPCDGMMFDRSGRGLGTGKIADRLGDAFTRLAFGSGETCPTTFQDIADKILDAGCSDHGTAFVSETAQLTGVA